MGSRDFGFTYSAFWCRGFTARLSQRRMLLGNCWPGSVMMTIPFGCLGWCGYSYNDYNGVHERCRTPGREPTCSDAILMTSEDCSEEQIQLMGTQGCLGGWVGMASAIDEKGGILVTQSCLHSGGRALWVLMTSMGRVAMALAVALTESLPVGSTLHVWHMTAAVTLACAVAHMVPWSPVGDGWGGLPWLDWLVTWVILRLCTLGPVAMLYLCSMNVASIASSDIRRV